MTTAVVPAIVIISVAVMHHCFPLENVMPGLLRWLRPGGVFVGVEPVSYLTAVEWLRNHSGIPGDALDEGERKLNAETCGMSLATFPMHASFISTFSGASRGSGQRVTGCTAEWTS